MKVESLQPTITKFSYLTQVAATQWYMIKGRPGMVLEIINISVYNDAGASMTKLFVLHKHLGVVHRLEYYATLNSKTVFRSDSIIYLTPGDELGIEIIGNAANDPMDVSISLITWIDPKPITPITP